MRVEASVKSLICHLLIAGSMVFPVAAQDIEFDPDEVDVSYIYAAVMGTGSYKINDRKIAMIRLPFSWTQRKVTDTEAGFKWSAPVSFGQDSVGGSNWLDELFPDDLVTLTIMPGFEYQLPVTPDWVVKPFFNLGMTHDFVSDENIVLGVLGLSSVARFDLNEDWELRWGNKVRFAAEYQLKSHFTTSFGIFEAGFDIRRGTGFTVLEREVDIGGYYRFQHFLPEWTITDAPDIHSDIDNVHELGFSVGLKKPRKIFGISFNRVRVGYKSGGDIKGLTIGGEFPF